MTQDNSSSSSSGQTPDQAAAPAKKSAPAAKKTAARKTPAKKTASVKTTEPAPAKEKTPAEKPKTTAKNKSTGTADAKGTKTPGEKPPASGTAKAGTAVKTGTDAKAKAPAKPRAAAKAKTPPAPKAAAAPAQAAETPLKTPAARADKASPAEAAKAPVEAQKTPAGAPGKEAAKPKQPRRRAAPKQAPKPAETAAKAAPAPEKAPVATKTAPAEAPKASPEPAALGSQATLPGSRAEFSNGQVEHPEAPSKPASRRSRRGGRRRNKSRAAAENNGAETAQAPAAEASAPREKPGPSPDREPSPEKLPGKDTAKQPQQSGSPKTPARETVRETAGNASRESARDKQAAAKAEPKTSGAKRKMFISVLSGELVEVVLAEEGAVVEYYVEMQHQAKVKGNIYKGVVSNIDANLQAAFISYAGGVKNGFLQIDEVHPEYYTSHHDPAKGRNYPPIQKILKPGQEILVQVVKEPAGTKGAFLTSYLSLPGRFLVLTPGREQIGVSRKVDSDEERTRLRGLLEGIKPGKGLGVIVRTVSTGASKTSLQRDLQFLKRLWKDVRAKGQTSPAPSLIYEELDLSTRAVRDYLSDDVQEVWLDDTATAEQVKELASLLFPKKENLVQVHQESSQSLFERFSLQKQLDQIHSREVSLPSGGSLVIDKTEALTAIDINSGRSGGKSNFEDMAYRTNLEAAKAIPLQLHLRDIGGQIVADFIEMRDRDHWREVEKAVRNGMKGDRARYDVGKIGPFGMLEIVRQRLGSSAISISTEPCPCCKGTGIRRNMEWQAMQALREIARQLRQAGANNQTAMAYQAETELAFYLLNTKRTILQSLEHESGVTLSITPKPE